MNIICDRQEIIKAMSIVTRAVPTRTTLEILECVLIFVHDNKLFLLANNLEMGIQTCVQNTQINQVGELALDARTFFEIIKKMPDDKIFIAFDSNNNLVAIKSGRAEFKIACQNSKDFPRLPEINKTQAYKILTRDMCDSIKQTIFAASLDESKPVLMGELIEIKNQKVNFVALDGFRIAFKSIDLQDNCQDASVIIPSKSLGELARILSNQELDKQIDFYLTDKHALFEFDSCVLITRLLDGKFLDYANIFKDDHKIQVQVNCNEFLCSIERASLISLGNQKNPVKLNLQQNQIVISSNTEINSSCEELTAEINFKQNPELEIAFNPKYLIDALKSIASDDDDDDIILHFSSQLDPCELKAIDNSNSRHLILPLKLF